VIEIAWQNTDIARVVDPKRVLNCQSFLLWIFIILYFVLGSHLILERNMMLLSKGILTKYFDQTPTCKIKDNQS
jgi:hypothetical protein